MVLIDCQPCIDENWNNAGSNGPPEQYGKVDRVEQNESNSIFRLDAHTCQHWADARGCIAQFPVGQIAGRIDKCGLLASALSDIPIHKIDRGIVVAQRRHPRRP